jgi:hypothetical protein
VRWYYDGVHVYVGLILQGAWRAGKARVLYQRRRRYRRQGSKYIYIYPELYFSRFHLHAAQNSSQSKVNMKSTLLTLGALATLSSAHYTFPELLVAGKGTGQWNYVRKTANYQSNGVYILPPHANHSPHILLTHDTQAPSQT